MSKVYYAMSKVYYAKAIHLFLTMFPCGNVTFLSFFYRFPSEKYIICMAGKGDPISIG